MQTKIKTNLFLGFFEFIFASWIEGKKKRTCENCKDLVTLIGSTAVSILGFCGIIHKLWLLVIALTVAIITILLFLGIQHVINKIDTNEAEMTRILREQVSDLQEENKKLVNKNKEEEAKNSYLISLWAETSLLAKAIQKANRQKNTKGLYSKIGNSVAAMTTSYLNSPKENLSVHLYAYDGKARMVRRVDVESFVRTMQAADENKAKPIDSPDVSVRYYARALKSKKTFFVLPNNDAIRKNLAFPNPDEEVIAQYTQYAAMSCDVGGNVKLYVEIISYNGLQLGQDYADIQRFLEKAVAPLSSILSMVGWNAIRSDCSEKRPESE